MQREQKYATPFSSEENGVARQKNFDGACAAAVVSASLSLAEQERREDGARQPVVVIVPYPFFPDHGTRICYPGILPPLKGEVARRAGGVGDPDHGEDPSVSFADSSPFRGASEMRVPRTAPAPCTSS